MTPYIRSLVGRLVRPLINHGGAGGAGPEPPTLVSITVTSALGTNPTWRPTASGDRLQFTATGHYSDASTADLTATVTWGSGTTGTATIASNGQATAVSAKGTLGAATTSVITATSGAVSGNTTLSVDVDRDATSNKRVPVNAYQLGLLGATFNCTAGYLCQELTGNLTDFVAGSRTLTAANTPTYNATITGWARKALQLANSTGQRFAHATFANAATTSIMVLAYVGYHSGTVTAGNHLFVHGGNNDTSVTNGDTANETKVRYREGTNIAESAGSLTVGTVYPVCLRRNITGTEADLFTDTEKLSPTFDVAAGTVLSLGCAAGTTSAPVSFLYVLVWDGAAAEKTDAQIKDIIQTLDWTVTGY
jgi:hypothetical protein